MRKISLAKLILLWLLLLLQFPTKITAQPKGQNPNTVFEQFWTIMDQNYAFFELKKIDWEAVHEEYSHKITAHTSEDELFNLLVEILRPFNDAHIKLKTTGANRRSFNGTRLSGFSEEFPTDSLKTQYFETVKNSLSSMGFDSLKFLGPVLSGKNAIYNHHTFEYAESGEFAYVKISWFFYDWLEIQKTGARKDGQKFLDGFRLILDKMASQKGLILDLRNNIGGVSGLPQRLAANFATEKFIGEYTCERKKAGHESFTKVKSVWVKPKKENPWLKPVVLLVNDETVSASEEFVLMMKNLPQVKVVGVPSQGALSDIYEQKLSNGWSLSLSNMRFYSSEKVCYENVGIPVDVESKNTRRDLNSQVDAVLKKGLETLREMLASP
ncbi:MAG: S41 family peptidase [Bacteroidia bacterium]|nr:S41 family peptidase [Bacteroidia bacterium]